MSQKSTRNLQLDILRGVAILLVFGRHLELARPEGVTGFLADVWFRIGWLGVDLFFVLSGFLIGGLLVSELQKYGSIDVGRFLVRRGLKIYPPYFVFIGYLILMPAAKAVLGGANFAAAIGPEWAQYWPNLLFLQNYVGKNPAGHTWSLAVEEHFYLLLPFALVILIAIGRVRALIPMCLLGAPVLFLGARWLSVSTNDAYAVKMSATHLRLDALLFGVGIRAVAQYLPEWFAAARPWRGVLFLVGIVLWLPNVFISPDTALVRTLGLTGTFVGSGAFLLATYLVHGSDFGRWERLVRPVAAFVAWIGVYSYAIYLWHVTAMGILGRVVGGRLLDSNGGVTSQPIWIITTLVVCGGSILLGVLASKIVEWPVLRLRDRFFPSRSGSLPAGSGEVSTAAVLERPVGSK